MQAKRRGLVEWVDFFSQEEIPVMRKTARELEALHQNQDRLSARGMADVIANDPLLTVKLLRHLQFHKRRSQTSELVQVEQALLMLGLEVFFSKVKLQPSIDEMLHGRIEALTCVLHVVHRSQRASSYALDWAVYLQDNHYEEVRIAALLRDLSEILMWCFAPDAMLEIHHLQHNDKALRSRAVQEQVLGFSLVDLQRALAKEWHLPELLLNLMDPACARQPRVRNVALAVNLARHSANGWDDAALPDDYTEISRLLNVTEDQVMIMVSEDEGLVCDLSKPRA